MAPPRCGSARNETGVRRASRPDGSTSHTGCADGDYRLSIGEKVNLTLWGEAIGSVAQVRLWLDFRALKLENVFLVVQGTDLIVRLLIVY